MNYRLDHGRYEHFYSEFIRKFARYQICNGSKMFFALADNESEIIYDSSPIVQYRFGVGEKVYCKMEDNRWKTCRVIMHSYPLHLESQSYGLSYAAYQVQHLDGSQHASFVTYDNDQCIQKHQPDRPNKRILRNPVATTSEIIMKSKPIICFGKRRYKR